MVGLYIGSATLNNMKMKSKAGFRDGEAGNSALRQGVSEKTKFSAWMEKHFFKRVPEAFEDELGFHYGSRPANKVPATAPLELAGADSSFE
jgi:hypothetical protein